MSGSKRSSLFSSEPKLSIGTVFKVVVTPFFVKKKF